MKKHITFEVTEPPEPSASELNAVTTTPRGSLSVPVGNGDGDVDSLASDGEYPACPAAQWKNQKSIRPQLGASRALNPITRRKHRDYVIDPGIVKGQVADYVVANYDLESVAKGIAQRNSEYQSLLRTIVHPSTIGHAILGITWKYLLAYIIGYYMLQIPYHLRWICPEVEEEDDDGREVGLDPSSTAVGCVWDEFVVDYKEQERNGARYVTFILGFYVSQVIKRWWDQIRLIPEIDPIANYMAGLVQRSGDSYDSIAALAFKKRLLRYCLLSWTMCFTSISKPLHDLFANSQDYMDKGLLTESELEALQVPGGSDDGWKDKWWVPITWAISLVNAHESQEGFKIKDQKDFIGTLNKYQQRLEDCSLYQNNPLPLIYGQAVQVTIIIMLLMSIIAEQQLIRLVDHGYDASVIIFELIIAFPIFPCVKLILMVGWLSLANILRNPFHTDKHYDLDLNQKLDINIWKASTALKNMSKLPRV